MLMSLLLCVCKRPGRVAVEGLGCRGQKTSELAPVKEAIYRNSIYRQEKVYRGRREVARACNGRCRCCHCVSKN